MMLCLTEPEFFRKSSFAQNTGRMGQNRAKNRVFSYFFKITCSILKIYIICFVFVNNLYNLYNLKKLVPEI